MRKTSPPHPLVANLPCTRYSLLDLTKLIYKYRLFTYLKVIAVISSEKSPENFACKIQTISIFASQFKCSHKYSLNTHIGYGQG